MIYGRLGVCTFCGEVYQLEYRFHQRDMCPSCYDWHARKMVDRYDEED